MALMLITASGAIALPTDGSTCEEHCLQRRERLFHQCVDDGGEEKDCDRRATLYLESCRRDECGEYDPTPACDRLCAAQADESAYNCWASGGLLELCIELSLTGFGDCVQKLCDIDLPDPPCPVVCRLDADDRLRSCLDQGIASETCALAALQDAQACIGQNCPPISVCDGACTSTVHQDGVDDAVFRPTDIGLAGTYDPNHLGPIDLGTIRIGAWQPIDAAEDVFAGDFVTVGDFVRIDLTLRGLVNPPGPLGPTTFDPYRYGPKPLYGFIEIDMDRDADTGGEIHAPLFRYLGNVSRFGGLPAMPRFFGRVAKDSTAFIRSFEEPPYIERHGEEFHIAFLGNQIASIDVLDGNTNGRFDRGEDWLIWGKHFHRAHGYEPFSFADGGTVAGEYAPEHPMLFSHDEVADVTRVSIVFPLSQMGSALLYDEPPGPINTDPTDQASVFEGLMDLRNSAEFIAAFPTGLPEEDIISRWVDKNPSDFLDPRQWLVTAIVGTSYARPAMSRAYFVWTDVFPNPVLGDMDGSGFRGTHDAQLVADWILNHDLADGVRDQSAPVPLFAGYLSVFDVNQDGRIDGRDILLSDGDADHDGDADLRDFAILQSCFENSSCSQLCASNDFNRNDHIDEQDALLFRWTMGGPK